MNDPFASPSQRRGFLLILVVVMIAICVMIMSRIASSSLRQAALANEEEREMRNRWASISLGRFGMQHAVRIPVQPYGHSKHEAPQSTLLKVHLANKNWRLHVANEAGKVPVARLAARYDETVCNQIVDSLIAHSKYPVDIELRFPQRGARIADPNHPISTAASYRWEHWLHRWESTETVVHATEKLTLWGNGKINLRQASPETVDVMWRQLFGRSAPRNLALVLNHPDSSNIEQVISAIALRESQAQTARDWFTLRGECYSSWVFCEDDRRFRTSLFVQWGSSEQREGRRYEY